MTSVRIPSDGLRNQSSDMMSILKRVAVAIFVLPLLANVLQAADVLSPLPSSSSNAALHYQRAILFLAEVEPEQRKLLRKPIWQIVNPETTADEVAEIDRMLISCRYSIRAAMIGASQAQADFGTNLRAYASSKMMPHVGPMSSLAKLLTLHGVQKQAEGDSQRAAEIFLMVIRMGSHMQQQLTLAESLEGEAILETGYHALCHWAVRCPDTELISSVRSSLSALSTQGSSPAAALGYEASVVELALNDVELAFPDGNWAEIVLRAVDAAPASSSPEAMRKAAKDAVIKRGVPGAVFESSEAFASHINKLRSAHAEYYRRSMECLGMPLTKAIENGQAIYDEFFPRLKALGDPNILNPGQIAAYYAVQKAEQQLANLVLVVSAHKEDGLFPADLSGVADHFGDTIPPSPFGSGELVYTPTADRKGLEMHYPGSEIAGIKLPKVSFEYSGSSKR